ncbi:MAG: multicopper oxidase domain-containing protein [Actinomycetota bacterium]|jgi:FtsP/CotA-like multicopper oxidase with cupredoxin domain
MTGQTTPSDDLFTTDVSGLPEASPPQVIRLSDGDQLDLTIAPVRKHVQDADLRMLGYNGSIPGPTLHVDQGSEITVHVTNAGDVEATVHWHGLRLENRYDGVPHETQSPIPIGGEFTYKVQFPDAGFYWYHPHIREDFGLEMGLYGTIVVEPSDPSYWPPADRELSLTVDDLLVEDGHVAPFHRSGPNYTAMGRFGNVMLTNGETTFSGEAAVGDVVRLYLVNTANTRIFDIALPGARMKLVGGDSGRYERETFVDEVMLAPSERAVVDVMFEHPGEVRLEHRTPDRTYDLGAFVVSGDSTGTARASFGSLRVDPALSAEHASIDADLERAPDKVLAFVASMPLLYGDDAAPATSYACPMHPDVTATEPGSCPKCGMQLLPVRDEKPAASSYVCPMHPEVTSSEPGTCPKCGMKLVPSEAPPPAPHENTGHEQHDERSDGLEWEDLMPEINRASEPGNMRWMLIDRQTGAENGAITWAFTVGDRVKIRLVNEMESDHPMHHPFHVHGAGRFLVLSRDGQAESNLVWKDTVLVRAGQTVDILLDVSNPGLWMAHCHIAEHAQSGMMFSFDVSRRDPAKASS